MKQIKQAVTQATKVGLVALAMANPTQADIGFKKTGLNQIQQGYTSNENHKTRAIINVGFGNDDMSIKYQGLHQKESTSDYFSSNSVVLDLEKALSPAIRFNITGEDFQNPTFGFHTDKHVKYLGADYGWLYVSGDHNAANIQGLVGYKVTDNFSIDLMNSSTYTFDTGDFSHYTEVQANYHIKDNASLIARAEIKNFDTIQGFIGLGWKF